MGRGSHGYGAQSHKTDTSPRVHPHGSVLENSLEPHGSGPGRIRSSFFFVDVIASDSVAFFPLPSICPKEYLGAGG